MSKKEFAIVFGVTANLTCALANVVIGLKKYSPNLADEIVIYHDEISENDQKILNSILPCRFIKYEFPINDTSKFNEAYFNQFSKLAYSRYECFNLLKEYNKVLWLDVDILIQKDISGILDFCKNGFGIISGLSPDIKLIDQLFKPINGFDMNKKAYSSGTFIVQDNLPNYDKLTQWCYDKTCEYAEFLYLPDQAVLNFMIQKFNITPDEIDLPCYCCHPTDKKHKKAYILHSYRPEKFWNFYSIKEWNENYKYWLKRGGTPTKIKKADFLSLIVNKKWPDAPNPIRKPRQFFIFLYKKLIKNSCSMDAKSFNFLFIKSIAILFAVTMAFNIIIDPFYVFKTPLFTRINREKPELKRQERITKIIELKLSPKNINTVFVGASTVDMGINANYYSLKTGRTAKNIAIVGPDIIELINYLKIVHKIHPEIKTFILGLDFFAFNETPGNNIKFNESKYITLQELSEVLISLDSLKSSIETLKYNIYDYNIPIYTTFGTKVKLVDNDISKKFELILSSYINGNGYYKNYVISRKKLNYLKDFKKYCEDNNTKLIIFINPIHFSQFQAIKTASAWNQFKQWKKEISLISPYYDFSNLNTLSIEPIKPNMYSYFDPIHYNSSIGNKIIDKIVENKANFGNFITVSSVNRQNNELDKKYQGYSNENIKLINWVKSLKK